MHGSFLKLSDLLQVPLEVVAPLDHSTLKGTELSLSGDHQLTNAGLAVALCKSWLQSTGNWGKLFQHVSYILTLFLSLDISALKLRKGSFSLANHYKYFFFLKFLLPVNLVML